MRKTFCKVMMDEYRRQRFAFLTGDLGFNALEPLREVMGEHFINAGVAEQNMVSVAAGIARTGVKSWVYSIAPFVYARPYEQIRNDICLHDLPVTLVGNGGGYGYGVMGATHHAIEDYGSLLCLQNMNIFAPAFPDDLEAVISKIDTLNKPAYLRLGINEGFEGYKVPEYSPCRKLLNGNNGVLLAIGSIAGRLVKEFFNDAPDNRPAIWAICELPFSGLLPELESDISENKRLCVVEEHVAHGGLGQIMAKHLLENNIKLDGFHHLHAKGYVSGLYGSQAFHRKESGLTKENIMEFFANG